MKKTITLALLAISFSCYSQKIKNSKTVVKKSKQIEWVEDNNVLSFYEGKKPDTITKRFVNKKAGTKYYSREEKNYTLGISFTYYDGKKIKTSVCDSLFKWRYWDCQKVLAKKVTYVKGVKVSETEPFWDDSGLCTSQNIIYNGYTGTSESPYYYGNKKEPIKVISIQTKTIIN